MQKQGQDGRDRMGDAPDRVSVGPEYTSMGEGSVQNSYMCQSLAEFSSLVLKEVPCAPPHTYTSACFSGGQNWCLFSIQPLVTLREQWDILHTQANGTWRRTPMNTGLNFGGRRAEAFLQGWTQEKQPGGDWLLIQMPGPSLTAFLLKVLRRQQLKPVSSRR